jgi:hypothetical protein
VKNRPTGFRLLSVCDVISADAVRDYLSLLGVTTQVQRLLPELALELKSREDKLLDDPRDPSRMAGVIAEVAAESLSPTHLEALSALLYIAAVFTEEEYEQKQRLGWNQIFRASNWQLLLDSLEVPPPVRSTIVATTDAYRIRTDRLSRLLQDADAKWISEGRLTVAPEHQVDSFIGLASRRYFLETARIIRFIANERQVAAIETVATRQVGFALRLQ